MGRTTDFPIRLPIYIPACIARAWVASGTLSGYRPPLPPHPLLGRIAYPAFELSCDRRCSVAQISRPIGRPFDRQFLDLDEEMRTAIDAQALSAWSQTRPMCPALRSSFLAAIATDRK